MAGVRSPWGIQSPRQGIRKPLAFRRWTGLSLNDIHLDKRQQRREVFLRPPGEGQDEGYGYSGNGTWIWFPHPSPRLMGEGLLIGRLAERSGF
jgi:hypothetical protein